jgi:uncharacterized protein (TIGR00369 family)
MEEHYRKLEAMYQTAPVNDWYLPVMTVGKGNAEITIDVHEKFFHAANAAHGSIYFKMLDDAAFFAANSIVEDVFVLTSTFNLNLIRPVTEGKLISTGTVLSASKRFIVAEAKLVDHRGKLVAVGRGNFAKSTMKLTADIGYALKD